MLGAALRAFDVPECLTFLYDAEPTRYRRTRRHSVLIGILLLRG